MKKNTTGVSKYRAIILSIALFIVFDLGVLIVNFYISKQFAIDAQTIDLAGRQATLAQRMTKSLFEIKNKVNSDYPYQINLDELRESIALFDTTHEAFINGGNIMGTAGIPVSISPITDSVGTEILGRGGKIWDGFKQYIDPLMQKDYYVSTQEVQDVANYATSYNVWLLKAMTELTVHVRKLAQDQARRLRLIQLTGITLAIINFFIILFHFIRQLRAKDSEIQSAKRETDKIMETVNEGLFLINKEGEIGAQHSASLPDILRLNSLEKYNFFQYLSKITPKKTLDTAKDYIEVLFRERVKENLVKKLNPLQVVEANIDGQDGQYETRFLSFSFNRVVGRDNLTNLLVTAKDITKEVMLEKELESTRENASRQMDLLTEILPLDLNTVREFLAQTTDSLGTINNALKSSNNDPDASFKQLLDSIYRTIHRVKGDAAAVGFTLMQEAAHEFETQLEKLKNQPKALTGNDFIPIALGLEELYRIVETVTELIDRLRNLNHEPTMPAATQESQEKSRWDGLRGLAHTIASDSNKLVELHLSGFKTTIPTEYEDSLYHIAVQLVRNAVAHGIEDPAERNNKKKSEYGQVMLSLKPSAEGGLELVVQDDGRSLDVEKIKQAAIRKDIITQEQGDSMSNEQILLLLFQPGFSTTETADLNSGRGVGMDSIVEQVKKLNGRLKVAYSLDKYTSFRILLPTIQSA